MLSKILLFVIDCAHSFRVRSFVHLHMDGLRSRLVEVGCRSEELEVTLPERCLGVLGDTAWNSAVKGGGCFKPT